MSNIIFDKVIVNNYSIEIIVNNKVIKPFDRHGFHHFILNNGDKYKIKLSNNNPTRCDVIVYIGGKQIGAFRLNAWQQIVLNKKFTFSKNKSYNNSWKGYECDHIQPSTGIVKAVFKPEAGSCGYGCIQEYDNYCTDWHKTTIGPTGPQGENGVITPENSKCMFGLNNGSIGDNRIKPSCTGVHTGDQMNAMYQMNQNHKFVTFQKSCDDSWSKSFVKNNVLKQYKMVPSIKDYDAARRTVLQARLVQAPQ